MDEFASTAGVRTFTRALRFQCQDAAPHVRAVDAVMTLMWLSPAPGYHILRNA